MRERLPDRRVCEAIEVEHVWAPATEQEMREHLLVTIGRYDDGRIGEVFINSQEQSKRKLADRVVNLQHDVAILISIALQHGAPIEELSAALGRGEVNHMGRQRSMPHTIAGTVLDVLAREQRK